MKADSIELLDHGQAIVQRVAPPNTKDNKMKTLIALLTALSLLACTSKSAAPEQTLILEKEIQGMSRNEVIIAIQECESSGMRAVLIQSKRKINNWNADIVVDITCAPRFKFAN